MSISKGHKWARSRNKKNKLPRAGSDGKSGYVYVIYLGIENIYKIGRSSNFETRFSELRASNPMMVGRIVSRVDDMCKREAHLHEKYGKLNMERELFRLEPEMLDDIQSYLDSHKPEGITGIGRHR